MISNDINLQITPYISTNEDIGAVYFFFPFLHMRKVFGNIVFD
jgi:hypothetical protein